MCIATNPAVGLNLLADLGVEDKPPNHREEVVAL